MPKFNGLIDADSLVAYNNVAAGQYVSPLSHQYHASKSCHGRKTPFASTICKLRVADETFFYRSEGVLSDPEGLLVVKPCTQAEVSFYESAVAQHPSFVQYMPTFMGTLKRDM